MKSFRAEVLLESNLRYRSVRTIAYVDNNEEKLARELERFGQEVYHFGLLVFPRDGGPGFRTDTVYKFVHPKTIKTLEFVEAT